jgi:hypothetical protein
MCRLPPWEISNPRSKLKLSHFLKRPEAEMTISHQSILVDDQWLDATGMNALILGTCVAMCRSRLVSQLTLYIKRCDAT